MYIILYKTINHNGLISWRVKYDKWGETTEYDILLEIITRVYTTCWLSYAEWRPFNILRTSILLYYKVDTLEHNTVNDGWAVAYFHLLFVFIYSIITAKSYYEYSDSMFMPCERDINL